MAKIPVVFQDKMALCFMMASLPSPTLQGIVYKVSQDSRLLVNLSCALDCCAGGTLQISEAHCWGLWGLAQSRPAKEGGPVWVLQGAGCSEEGWRGQPAVTGVLLAASWPLYNLPCCSTRFHAHKLFCSHFLSQIVWQVENLCCEVVDVISSWLVLKHLEKLGKAEECCKQHSDHLLY